MSRSYRFEYVGDQPQYYHCGDIKAISLKDGREIFVEVKNDGVIYKTKNVLCEEEVYYNDSGTWEKGNMYCSTDIYVVVSQPEQKMYVIDFNILKRNYKKGEHRFIEHPDQTTDCYLCSLGQVRRWDALIATINYDSLLGEKK